MLTGSIKISELDSLSTITWADFFPLVQSGSLTTFKVNITTLEAWLSVSGSVISASWASASLTSVQSISASWASASLTSVQSISSSWASASISSSFSGVAISASYAPFTQAFQASASWASASLSSSYALSASYSLSGMSASYALSASYAPVLGDTVPIGTIFSYSGNSLPANYLECNGDAKITSSFLALYQAIQNNSATAAYGYLCDSFGNKNSVGPYFKIPDLRGEFVRGWDHNRGIDAGRTSGSFQIDAFKTHQHTVPRDNRTPSGIDHNGAGSESGGTPDNVGASDGGYSFKTLVNSDGGAADTHPRNLAMMYIIKYTNTTNFATSGVSLAGDVIGNTAATNVVAIQSVPVTSSAPSDGQYLVYSAAAGQWLPTSYIPPAGGPKFLPSGSTIVSFSSATGFVTYDLASKTVPSTATAAIVSYLISTGQGPVTITFRAHSGLPGFTINVGALGGGDVAYIQNQVIIPTSGSKVDIACGSGGSGNVTLLGYF